MNCDRPAVALLTFAPPEAKAWLYDLEAPDPTGGIMLCRHHANSTVVPMSWQLIDARDPAWPGPPGSQAPLQAMSAASAEEFLPPVRSTIEDEAQANQAQATQAPAAEEFDELAPPPAAAADYVSSHLHDLPSDTSPIEQEFAALQADLPVTPIRYADATVASAPPRDVMIDVADEPDPSLFELPFTDSPAVTPHPGF